jgi:hypothetical protein
MPCGALYDDHSLLSIEKHMHWCFSLAVLNHDYKVTMKIQALRFCSLESTEPQTMSAAKIPSEFEGRICKHGMGHGKLYLRGQDTPGFDPTDLLPPFPVE